MLSLSAAPIRPLRAGESIGTSGFNRMTTYEDKGAQPTYGKVLGFDHVHWWVSNAKITAEWFCDRFGFTPVAYRGLETGHRNASTHVVKQRNIFFVFSSPLLPDSGSELGQDMGEHVALHGDGVKDLAFTVENAAAVFDAAVKRGGTVVRPLTTEEDEHGRIVYGTVKTYGDTVHTFVQRDGYTGVFWPNFSASPSTLSGAITSGPDTILDRVDHCVGNQPDAGMLPAVEFYEKVLQFHRFWSVDDTQMHTEYSALRSVVMADYDEVVKMPINEPAKGKRKSQIQEFVDYYGGAGVQHIALSTRDIITSIQALKARGVDFLPVPDAYYESLTARLDAAGIKVKEDLATIRRLNILVDFDSKGYLLQLFTRPLMDRPTVFIEIIQREGNSGFGAGNFKSLFEAIEREQEKRGNLIAEEDSASGAAAGAASGGGKA